MRSLLTLVLVVISTLFQFYLPTARANIWDRQSRLHLVEKIYVGSMGETDEAERFRLLLEEELSAKGFTVVDRSEKAEAILSGALSVRVHDKKTRARVYVKLETPEGVRLWGKDFGSRFTSPFNRTEPVKLRAQDVANALRDAWERPK
jgi:hypothetical protein